jgi:hypothetical protein
MIGVDPGKKGAIAWCDDGGPIRVLHMPETESELWGTLYELSLAGPLGPHEECFAVLEAQHSFPGQGVASTWTFAQGYGGLRMALIGLGIPFRAVSPVKWQKAMGCLTHGDKHVSKRRAQELLPGVKWTLVTADAGLICAYARANYAKLLGQES